ncbi:hypothetical protein [Clostridium perfringens]|uniref:hypothetical protein n=1 Tax=Clostridium perfringens TaxID=1502 RepID=UPI001CCE8A24|nr:hypothetical protein [Clostridium perfringens]MDK0660218.1 hypothetical protein [Clostridium perfringens]UBK33339.1 hypothetical protein KLF45_15230 [Clostridium perfringens]UBL03720.1 hypothetical protein KLF24_15330 [Clostridium perfringens]
MENGAYLQTEAISLQYTLGRIFNLDYEENVKFVDAAEIRKSPYMWMTVMLMNKYNTFDMTIKDKIKGFINEYYDCANKTMDEIGLTKIDKMIKQFRNIMKET